MRQPAVVRPPELHYPLGDTLPEPGRTLDVAPGVRWLRMALPFALNHINLWLLQDEVDGRAGWTAVDCGVANDDTRARWRQLLDDGLQGQPLLRVIVTHMHPDHVGLAHWLTQTHGCRLWMSAADYQTARLATVSTSGVGGDAAAAFFARHGLTDPAALDGVRQRRNHFSSLVPAMPEAYHRLLDGQVLHIGGHAWTCIAGYGHAPEHMALHAPDLGVLISGDMVLPTISTNVSVSNVEPEGDPLALYLQSIARLRALPADTLVLPSHGRPFVGLHERITQLERHHDERLDDALQACRQRPQSAADLLPVLFKRALDLHQTTFAMGEAVAHLHALQARGSVSAVLDSDGVMRFAATGAA
jgi:glyoxylase-like metal-dependent hydrolase (beta-lactamase superfamily II)